jgi:hypothetical protein
VSDSVTLTGKNAEVRDRQRGTVQGSRIIRSSGDKMTVESGNKDRAVTTYPIKKR